MLLNKNLLIVSLKIRIPEEMPEFNFTLGTPVSNLLKDAGLCSSTSEAMRMVKQGAAKIDGEKVADAKFTQSKERMFSSRKAKVCSPHNRLVRERPKGALFYCPSLLTPF